MTGDLVELQGLANLTPAVRHKDPDQDPPQVAATIRKLLGRLELGSRLYLYSWDGLQGPGQGARDDVWDTVTNNTLAGSDPLSKLKEERNSGPCP